MAKTIRYQSTEKKEKKLYKREKFNKKKVFQLQD